VQYTPQPDLREEGPQNLNKTNNNTHQMQQQQQQQQKQDKKKGKKGPQKEQVLEEDQDEVITEVSRFY